MDNNHETTSLQHHGVKGQKWGVRRYQNKDGSLTALGEKRMGIKSSPDKKTIEDLKDRRAARWLNIVKQRQDMRQEALDRANNRSIERAKMKLAKQKAQDESADQEANRKLLKEKLKQDKEVQKQDALDRATNRKLSKQKMDMEWDASKKQPKDISYDDYYELPDTPERQQESSSRGKKIVMASVVAVGGIALAVAAKKYGPSIVNAIKNSKFADMAKKVGKKATDNKDAVKDMAEEIVKEAAKAKTASTPKSDTSSSSVDFLSGIPGWSGSSAVPSGKAVKTPKASQKPKNVAATAEIVGDVMKSIGGIPFWG